VDDIEAILAKAGGGAGTAALEASGDDVDAILAKAGGAPPPVAAAPRGRGPNFDPAQELEGEDQPAAPPPTPGSLSRLASQAAQPFKDIGHGVSQANQFVANAMAHPVQTYRNVAANPGAYGREALRGINDNIPFANRFAAAHGGIPEFSAEDTAAAPGMRATGGVAGMPLANMVGGVAAKGIEAVSPLLGRATQLLADRAQEAQIARTAERLETKVNKTTRAGMRSDAVANAIRENPELRKAAGNDSAVAKATEIMAKKAQAELAPIYKASGPAVDAAAKAVANVDDRIAMLAKGDVNQAAAAKKLKTLREEFNHRISADISPEQLRAEQSAYQKNGYAKNIAGDPDVTATILAHREMSKAVGDALIEHVTGMKYTDALAEAARNPKSLAGRLLKANEQISAAHKIEAGIADRSTRVTPKHGLAKTISEIKHSPTGWALSKAPQALQATGNAFVDTFAKLGAERGSPALDVTGSAPPVPPAQPERTPTLARPAALANSIMALTRAGIPPETAARVAQQQAAGGDIEPQYAGLLGPGMLPDEEEPPTEAPPAAGTEEPKEPAPPPEKDELDRELDREEEEP